MCCARFAWLICRTSHQISELYYKDQLFGTIALLLARERELLTPHAFRDAIDRKMRRPRPQNRALIVDVLHATRDWKTWLTSLGISFAGYSGEDGAHSVRVLRRRCRL